MTPFLEGAEFIYKIPPVGYNSFFATWGSILEIRYVDCRMFFGQLLEKKSRLKVCDYQSNQLILLIILIKQLRFKKRSTFLHPCFSILRINIIFLASTSGILHRSPTRIKNGVLRINWVTLRKTWNYSIVFISLYPTSVVNDGIKLPSTTLE